MAQVLWKTICRVSKRWAYNSSVFNHSTPRSLQGKIKAYVNTKSYTNAQDSFIRHSQNWKQTLWVNGWTVIQSHKGTLLSNKDERGLIHAGKMMSWYNQADETIQTKSAHTGWFNWYEILENENYSIVMKVVAWVLEEGRATGEEIKSQQEDTFGTDGHIYYNNEWCFPEWIQMLKH